MSRTTISSAAVALGLFAAAVAFPAHAQIASRTIVEATAAKPVPCSVQAAALATLRKPPKGALPACDSSVDPNQMPLDDLIAIIPEQHPVYYYTLAIRLFEAGRKEEAVFWFYAGQMRFRIRVACHRDLKRTGEAALVDTLQQKIGLPINEWAGGDPEMLGATVERVRVWDLATPNGYEPKAVCRNAIDAGHVAFTQLRDSIVGHETEIRAARTRNGLTNR